MSIEACDSPLQVGDLIRTDGDIVRGKLGHTDVFHCPSALVRLQNITNASRMVIYPVLGDLCAAITRSGVPTPSPPPVYKTAVQVTQLLICSLIQTLEIKQNAL